jgi:hypothetical protein
MIARFLERRFLGDPDAQLRPEHQERIAVIARAWDYYEGRHPPPLAPRRGQPDDNVIVNLARPIVDKGVSLLVGKPVTFQVDETAAPDTAVERDLRAVWQANDQEVVLHDLALNGAIAGAAILKIAPQPAGPPRLIVLDPAMVDVYSAPGDIASIWRYRILYDLDAETEARQDIERREGGWVIRDYERRNQAAWRLIAETVWPYQHPPIAMCKNLPRPNSVWGYGDLDDMRLNDALNFVLSATRKILRLHAHPRTWGRGFTARQLESWGPGDLWTVPNPEASIQNLEMQSDLASSHQFALTLRQALFTQFRMPDLSQVGNLGALTNFGLRVLFADALERTATKRMLYGGLIRQVNRALAELAGYGPAVETTIHWSDPLPVNELEQIQVAQAKRALGLLSDETIVAELGYDYQMEQQRRQATLSASPGITEELINE